MPKRQMQGKANQIGVLQSYEGEKITLLNPQKNIDFATNP